MIAAEGISSCLQLPKLESPACQRGKYDKDFFFEGSLPVNRDSMAGPPTPPTYPCQK